MLKISDKTNLIESVCEQMPDYDLPNYHRDVYPYTEVPKIVFDGKTVKMAMPKEIFITDTTFRDGQQAVEPYTDEQIVKIYSLFSKLSGEKGIIRQTEFFVYGKRNIAILEKCRELNLRFPEITTWIRANKKDLDIVKQLNVKETGILASISDYHVFKKLGINRKEALNLFTSVVAEALEYGIVPRVHLEDLTRADFRFIEEFVGKTEELSRQAGVPVKYRLCDTLGFGVTSPEAALPRSVPKIISLFLNDYGVSSERMEWHGHNDFYRGVACSTVAWLYGSGAVNGSLFGRGERVGNVPLEAMVMEYAGLKGDFGGMNPAIITELADYFKNEIGYTIPENTPFVGENFNITRAGIHADGLMKDEEIYNIFDTKVILNKPPHVQIGPSSGLAGVAFWVNSHYGLSGEDAVSKNNSFVIALKNWVDEQYENGRQTLINDHELAEEALRIKAELDKLEQ